MDGIQRQFRKVDNVEEGGNRHYDILEVEGFKGGRMYDIRERIHHFKTEDIPIPIAISPRTD